MEESIEIAGKSLEEVYRIYRLTIREKIKELLEDKEMEKAESIAKELREIKYGTGLKVDIRDLIYGLGSSIKEYPEKGIVKIRGKLININKYFDDLEEREDKMKLYLISEMGGEPLANLRIKEVK